MPIGINGSGTITGISAGGLPDNVIVADDIAAGAVAPAKLSTGAPSWDSSGNLSFNSGYGSVATAYGCRAWVNFNGTGTVAIRADGGVSSITDNGVGAYTVNFDVAMPDANYAVNVTNSADGWTSATTQNSTAPTTTAVRVACYTGTGSGNDAAYVNVSIFR